MKGLNNNCPYLIIIMVLRFPLWLRNQLRKMKCLERTSILKFLPSPLMI